MASSTSPVDLFDELAAIFAAGLLRLPPRTRALIADAAPTENSEEFSQKALEVSAESRLHGVRA